MLKMRYSQNILHIYISHLYRLKTVDTIIVWAQYRSILSFGLYIWQVLLLMVISSTFKINNSISWNNTGTPRSVSRDQLWVPNTTLLGHRCNQKCLKEILEHVTLFCKLLGGKATENVSGFGPFYGFCFYYSLLVCGDFRPRFRLFNSLVGLCSHGIDR